MVHCIFVLVGVPMAIGFIRTIAKPLVGPLFEGPDAIKVVMVICALILFGVALGLTLIARGSYLGASGHSTSIIYDPRYYWLLVLAHYCAIAGVTTIFYALWPKVIAEISAVTLSGVFASLSIGGITWFVAWVIREA